jgi:hypothetical protein
VDAGDGIVDAVLPPVVVVPEAEEDVVVADESLGGVGGASATCLMATLGSIPGGELRLRSCSLTSSAANASSFSRLDFSERRRPRKSSASTFRCVSIPSAIATTFFGSSERSDLIECAGAAA